MKSTGTRLSTRLGAFRVTAQADLRALFPSLVAPFLTVRRTGLRENRTLLAVAVIGLAPLAIVYGLGNVLDLQWLLTVIALYVSVLWAAFFGIAFPSPNISIVRCLFCFFGTVVVMIGLEWAISIWPLSALYAMIHAPQLPLRVFGGILGVGVLEETCKALVLFGIWRRYGATLPNVMLFYGLISGLGFGVREGVRYALGPNLEVNSPVEYYLLNVLRLTSLPFLHAMWAGLAGYFIGLASLYPQRKVGLVIVAIALPAVLHGLYDALDGLPSLGVALLSVVVLGLYLRGSYLLERDLMNDVPAAESSPASPSPVA
jgi:RsiW-degrading membrane proteinase PrsW (M82 family)